MKSLKNQRDWKYIIIHHSATVDTPQQDWDAIKHYHTSFAIDGVIVSEEWFNEIRASEPTQHHFKTAWGNIGYHFGVEKIDGKYIVHSGRDINKPGIHTKGYNRKGIGICLIGNYSIQPPEEEAYQCLAKLCKSLMKTYNIRKKNIVGHNEVIETTECPGNMFDMKYLRGLV